MSDRFPNMVHENLARFGVRGRGVVAVSGGADSVALLRALADSSGELVIAHLNHQLRGADSDADAAFVAQLCPDRPHRMEAVDVAALARSSGDNLEAAARRARYAFLARVARESKASWVATAHTLDDQAETVLHRLIRGSGLRGLRGIAAERELEPGIALLRPMLTLSRQEVIAYLQEIGQTWRDDATNRDVAYTRNRIRYDLLPMLRAFNPAIAETLARTAAEAEEVYSQVEGAAADDLKRAELPKAGSTVILQPSALTNLPDHRVREMLYAIWRREGWPLGDMTREHWQRAADVSLGRAPSWDLPGGIRIAGKGRVIRVGPTMEM